MNGLTGNLVNVSPASRANFGGYTPNEQAEITRENNTTAYSANDIIVGAGVFPANILQLNKPNANNGYIVGAKLTSSDTGITGTFIVHIMNAAPETFTDNAALTLTASEMKTNYIGYFRVLVETIGGQKVAFPVNSNGDAIDLRVPFYTNNNQLYAILETVDGFSPSGNSTTFQLSLVYELNAPNAPQV